MCRALWVVVVGASDDAVARLRRAAGLEAQVVGTATSPNDARALAPTTKADAFVIDGTLEGARALAEHIRGAAPDAAVVWVGDDAPEHAHHATPWGDDLNDTLPGVITKALLARRR